MRREETREDDGVDCREETDALSRGLKDEREKIHRETNAVTVDR